MLNEEQIARFHRDGFVKGTRVLSDEEIETLRAETLRIIEGRDGLEKKPVQLANIGKPENPVWQIVNIWMASEPFAELVHQSQIGEEIAQLSGAREVRLWHDQIQYKPAQTGGANMWHQDSPYWPPLEPKERQLTAWVALDDVDEDNGCMKMVPGSHQWGDQVAFLHTLKSFDAMPDEWNGHALKVLSCPVQRGEVHYHHALTWHGSGENRSGRPRRAIALHYMTEQTRYNAQGAHPMNPYIKVASGEMLQGDAFPQVWPEKAKVR